MKSKGKVVLAAASAGGVALLTVVTMTTTSDYGEEEIRLTATLGNGNVLVSYLVPTNYSGFETQRWILQRSSNLVDWDQVYSEYSSGDGRGVTQTANRDRMFYRAIHLPPPPIPVIYQTSFEPAGAVLPGWTEWESGYHPQSWSGHLRVGEAPELTLGAFYTFTNEYDMLVASFLFQVPSEAFGDREFFEICDFYDFNMEEICDAYCVPGGRMVLFVNNRNAGTSPMPLGQQVRIWMRYQLIDGLSIGSVAWALPNQPEPMNGLNRAAIETFELNTFNTPVKAVLFGPWHNGHFGIYDDVSLGGSPSEMADRQ